MRMVLGVSAVGVVALAGASVAWARTAPPAQKIVLAAIAKQEARGHISPGDAARDRFAVHRAVRLIRHLPPSRSRPLASSLAQAAAVARRLTAPRAAAVFGQLAVNDDWFARHGPPRPKTDITDADGVVYRYFPGTGFEFHPLANFAALNADVSAKRTAAAARLANALIARGVPRANAGISWEYYFNYGGGRAPWRSGFAQAVAAQAFARTAAAIPDDAPQLNAEARAAYHAIPGRLVRRLGVGPWIKLYSFSGLVVLNAQLQSAISLADYASAESDTRAATLATRLRSAAARALPRFDTGYWTYYSLPHNPSTVSYQEYVVELLQRLAKTDSRFATAATDFASYQTQRPAFRLADAGPGAVSFWVSKPSTVRISALGGVRRLSVAGGWHRVSWRLPDHAGIFPVTIHATDWAGNSASVDALPIVRVVTPPKPKSRGKPKRPAKKRTVAAVDTRAATQLPPLAVGAGLGEPSQAGLAAQDGFGAVRMTLVWPAGASTPDPGAIAALNRLPAGTNLVLELYAPPPADDTSRGVLASYAASVAQQVPALHDLVLGPAPDSSNAAAYEAALAAVYDAVKTAAPGVRVDGSLDGEQTPRATLAALVSTFHASGRVTPLMDALDFRPAPAAGGGLWGLTSLSTLTGALDAAGFAAVDGTGRPPVLVDGVSFVSSIPPDELSLYASPTVGTTGLDEPSQAAAYAGVLKTVACRANVVAVLFDRLVDGPDPGNQSGLYYANGAPKSSLQPVVEAVATAQSPSRGCTPGSSAGSGTGAGSGTAPSSPSPGSGSNPGSGSGSGSTPPPPASSQAPASTATEALADPGALVFPDAISTTTPPRVQVGCTRACLYLVALQRAGDGAPVLARRGTASGNHPVTVALPHVRIAPGRYRFAVWLVSKSDPGPVAVDRSDVVATH